MMKGKHYTLNTIFSKGGSARCGQLIDLQQMALRSRLWETERVVTVTLESISVHKDIELEDIYCLLITFTSTTNFLLLSSVFYTKNVVVDSRPPSSGGNSAYYL